jgi:hypothetical protein
MNKGLESTFTMGNTSGALSGIASGLETSSIMSNRWNSIIPTAISEPKLKPSWFINGENVGLLSGTVNTVAWLMPRTSGNLFNYTTLPAQTFDQTGGTSFRPGYFDNALNGRAYIGFTTNQFLVTNTNVRSYSDSNASGNGMTYIFVIKRNKAFTGTRTIFDARDSSTLATPADLLLEHDGAGAITFEYIGGQAGLPSAFTGVAGKNLLNDWSIVTVKAQLRNDGGPLGPDNFPTSAIKRFKDPIDNRIGTQSPLDVYVNGVEQQKTLSINTFTNSDFNSDGSYRMQNKQMALGNKAATYGTGGMFIAAAMMIPTYISNAYQRKLENYFRNYYSLPF